MRPTRGLKPLQLPVRIFPPVPPRKSSYVALSFDEQISEQALIWESMEKRRYERRDSSDSTSTDPSFPSDVLKCPIPSIFQLKTSIKSRPRLIVCVLLSLLTIISITVYQRYENEGGGSAFRWWSAPSSIFKDSLTSSQKFNNEPTASSNPASSYHLPRRPIWIESHRAMMRAGQLVDWIATGEIRKGLDLSAHSRIDGLWTWVNGSDPRHNLARHFYAKDPTRKVLPPEVHLERNRSTHSTLSKLNSVHPFSSLKEILSPSPNDAKLQNTDSRFRDNGELLYSLRSAKMHLGEYLGTMHVLSTDFWEGGRPEGESAIEQPSSTSPRKDEERDIDFSRKQLTEQRSDRFLIEGGLQRLGQVPQWLDVDQEGVLIGQAAVDFTSSASEPPALILHHDWNTFRPLLSIDPSTQALPESDQEEADLLDWKLSHLPTFNSMAAESFLGVGIPGLSEIFTASSDDMALGRPLSTSDFASPLYGPVLHINHQLSIYPQENPLAGLGEAPSHHYSAWLLSERFGFRAHHYVVHVQKSHLTPLMLETRLIWGDEFSETSQKRFRGNGKAINSHMLSYGMNIERHREALLWSFFLLKVDRDGDGYISDSELHSAKLMMGWNGIDTKLNLKVAFPRRLSASKPQVERNFGASNFPKPLASEYEWTSMDGYAYSFNLQRGSRQWPLFYEEADDENKERFESPSCILNLKRCIKEERDAESLFKSFAFEQVDCGDCLITHLVGQSGELGLSAFLPEAEQRIHGLDTNGSYSAYFPKVETAINREEVPPHLPLDKKWKTADFRVESVVRNTGFSEGSKREFASLLISRYNYAIASAPVAFIMMDNPKGLELALKEIDDQELAFMCFNDDITSQREATVSKLHEWYEKRFDQKLDFEL